jgi:hypothetical protein
MTDLLNLLHAERATLTKKLAGVDAAIHALNGSNVATVIAVATGVRVKRTWTMSAAARKKISLAQKKRWAKAKR